MGFESLEKLELNSTEYCFIMEDTPNNSSIFKVFIPKLMPLFNYTNIPSRLKEVVDTNIFINDKTNKPTPNNDIIVQNYVTLKRFKNCWFRFTPSNILKGTRLACKVVDKNIRNIWLIDDEFNEQYADNSKPVFIRNPAYDILEMINVGDTVRYSTGSSSSSGTVSSKGDWGIMVNGTPITPDKILGVHKKAGEYTL